MKRLIVYDLDGTLVDTRQELIRANTYVLSRLGALPERLEAVHAFTGQGMRDLVVWGLQRNEPSLMEEAEALFAAYYAHQANPCRRLYPGALQVLEYFCARVQAVLTDRPNPFARDLVQALGVSIYFQDIIAGDSPCQRKPNPASLLALIAKSESTPEEVLFIGDSPVDIETGRRAGVLTIAVSHGMTQAPVLHATAPDALVEDFVQLLALARQEGW